METIWEAAIAKENYLETIIEDIFVYPGIKPFLKRLKERDCTTVVISSTYGKLVEIMLEKAGLLNFIDYIVSGDEISKGKPDPEPFLKGLEKTGLLPEEAIGLGDSIFDAKSCTSAGIQFIGLLTGKTPRKKFNEAKVPYLIKSIHDLIIK